MCNFENILVLTCVISTISRSSNNRLTPSGFSTPALADGFLLEFE